MKMNRDCSVRKVMDDGLDVRDLIPATGIGIFVFDATSRTAL